MEPSTIFSRTCSPGSGQGGGGEGRQATQGEFQQLVDTLLAQEEGLPHRKKPRLEGGGGRVDRTTEEAMQQLVTVFPQVCPQFLQSRIDRVVGVRAGGSQRHSSTRYWTHCWPRRRGFLTGSNPGKRPLGEEGEENIWTQWRPWDSW